ncbi:MFS transporter [Mycetocola tolaasinivorans]|uniref:MFS transporter n=1 Tax=Mycetocola tolaasinivorans TaxID=76635 RepID=A0A3L7A379_9MICO|nr:MFS transporter [Mycetocola tolaasinivorans]RLP74495.1 MFS transporter [Mycetocola tolaasinivorans]
MTQTVGENARPLNPLPIAIMLAGVGFIILVTEILPAGLLPQISLGLGVSPSLAGQGIVTFAIGCIVAAIPLTRAAASWDRRSLLLGVLVISAVSNLGTALAPDIVTHLITRFAAGLAAGGMWAMFPGYVRGFTPPERLGSTLSVAFLGVTLAFALGVPMGTLLGETVGWRLVFVIITALTVMMGIIALFLAPRVPGVARGTDARIPVEQTLGAAVRTPAVQLVLLAVVLIVVGQSLGYTYLAPILEFGGVALSTGLVFGLFGIASVLGTIGSGRFADRHLTGTLVSALSAGAVGLAGIGLSAWPGLLAEPVGSALLTISVMLWGYSFGGYSMLFQVVVAHAGGAAADAAQSVMVTVWNISIALGGFVGGVLLAGIGPLFLLPIAAILMAVSLPPVLRVLAGIRAKAPHSTASSAV